MAARGVKQGMPNLCRWLTSRRAGTPTLAVLLTFAGLTIGLTYPVIVQLDSSIAQNPRWSMDGLHHIYVLWWFKTALLDLHVSPAQLLWIYFPTGGYYPLLLTFSAAQLIGLPLLLFLSPVATYNVVFLLNCFLSGLSAYALCTYLTRSRWAGLLGGVIYAFFPGRMAHALSGHLALASTYLFPLYVLLLIETVRRPRWTISLACGMVLAAAMLVQPVYIPFLIAPITAVWLLYDRLVLHHKVERCGVLALGGAFVLAALIAMPLFWPALQEQMTGQGAYLETSGVVRFSADLLGVVAPPPTNPILNALHLVPDYARRVAPDDWRATELLTYAGLLPLALGVLAAVKRRRAVGAWTVIALIAAVLSLGPLLKFDGELVTLTADGVESGVPLPYALLLNMPLLSVNRAPARINTTLMLALAVLAAYGLDWLIEHTSPRWRPVLAVAACVVTLGELLVVWPCPTTPLMVPDYLAEIAPADDPGAVLNLPIAAGHAKERALFYQTVHRRPVFDSWFERPLPVFPDVAGFLDGLLAPAAEGSVQDDIIPRATADDRAAVARAEEVGHVFLFTPYVGYADAKMALLETAFGPPRSTEHGVAIYQVPAGTEKPDRMVYALENNDWSAPEQGWQDSETWHGRPARWMAASAELYIYSPRRQEGALQFTALPFLDPQRLAITVNQDLLPPLVIGEWITYTTAQFPLQSGLNQITLQALNSCQPTTGDPRCGGVSLAIAGRDSECAPYLDRTRCLGILFQDVRFTAASTGPLMQPVDVTLGGQVRLRGYTLRGQPSAGRELALTLYWQAVRGARMEADYTIFVHLLGADGALLAQHDGPPLSGVYPTSRWVGGDIFSQQISLPLPPDAQPGTYELLTGMYTYPDIQRLPVAGDRPYAQDGLVWLQSVEVSGPADGSNP